MGTMARRIGGMLVAVAACAPAATAGAGGTTEAPAAQGSAPPVVVTGGHDARSSWLRAQYRELQIRTRTERETLATGIELRVGPDVVVVNVVRQRVSVARGDRQIVIESPEALSAVQQLLGGSAAIFGVRAMLSDLEPVSALTAPDMALLSAAAFVASLVGDVAAPQRIADRFMEKHRGIYRQIRANGTCWNTYSNEVSNAWIDLQSCMSDAESDGFFRAAYERLACNMVWLMRSESAWFEYLKCLSPLTAVPH